MTDRERESGKAGEQESGKAGEPESGRAGAQESGHEFLPHDPRSARDAGKARVGEAPLEPWLADLVQDAMQVEDSDVPLDLMWARIRQQRRSGAVTTGEQAVVPRGWFGNRRTLVNRVLAVAATLAVGVAIGRYGAPSAKPGESGPTVAVSSGGAAPSAGIAQGASHATSPAVVAMEEHLARTVALLVTVRDESPDAGPGADVSGWARELVGTTRMLLDEPQLRDDRTRRLLQDLELVLVQIIQARGTAAPEARRAPSETMRETNLLPRVRAVVTASISTDELSFRGIAE